MSRSSIAEALERRGLSKDLANAITRACPLDGPSQQALYAISETVADVAYELREVTGCDRKSGMGQAS